ncbi:unnamed protein product [Tenebrio molitor]|nr:unnamed protein product [Tenebrio molitor]
MNFRICSDRMCSSKALPRIIIHLNLLTRPFRVVQSCMKTLYLPTTTRKASSQHLYTCVHPLPRRDKYSQVISFKCTSRGILAYNASNKSQRAPRRFYISLKMLSFLSLIPNECLCLKKCITCSSVFLKVEDLTT